MDGIEALADLDLNAAAAFNALACPKQHGGRAAALIVALDAILIGHAGPTIPSSKCMELIDALTTGFEAAFVEVHASLSGEKIAACLNAAIQLVCFWSADNRARASIDRSDLADNAALARVLRNILENFHLVAQLHTHAKARRQPIVDRIKAAALSALVASPQLNPTATSRRTR